MGRVNDRETRAPTAVGRVDPCRRATEDSIRVSEQVPAGYGGEWVRTLQRLAGNRAVVAALPAIQREEPAPAPGAAPPTTGVAPDGPGRVPDREEQGDYDDAFPDQDMATFRILVEPAHGYNCFAWAVGVTTMEITSQTLYEANYGSNLDGWTKYLLERHGFGRHADGLDATADVILYGGSPIQVLHAARKADTPYGRLTFTSKLGGQNESPVILHAPDDLEGGGYGRALRSFWRGAADPSALPTAPAPAPASTP